MSAVISVDKLRKQFRTPLRRKTVEILRGVSFSVEQGEVFGFLGPNGAGKTTTIRILMGLVAATGGSAALFGQPVPSRAARARLGFLPESPYFYDYLTVEELLDLTGRLFSLGRATCKRRSDELIEQVGLGHARQTPLRKFSKGMLQRAGIAQALMNDPELVVLDEPTSGLDPVGRREVREIILSLREQGKTVFFSSHILADVEAVSDRIGVIVKGRIRDVGSLDALLGHTLLSTEVTVRLPPAADGAADGDNDGGVGSGDGDGDVGGDGDGDGNGDDGGSGNGSGRNLREAPDPAQADDILRALRDRLGAHLREHEQRGALLTLTLGPEADVDACLARARAHGAGVHSVSPRYESLEDLFMRHVQGADPATERENRDGR